jgi:hypothetical protein
LLDSEGGERRVEFSRGRGAWASLPERYFPPFRGVRVDEDRHVMYLIDLDLDQVASGLRCDYKRTAALGAPRFVEMAGAK